ncbi:MAG: glycosyltransferase family 4 protein, partial [Sphingomicrobium sp.]
QEMIEGEVLIDVSRLIWRFWRGGLPTGIDRVCLAYVEHFANCAHAVVQGRGAYFVFTRKHSGVLFDLFRRGREGFRGRFVRLATAAFLAARGRPRGAGALYLNTGHTGLNEPSLGGWITENGLRAIFLIHDLIPLTHPEYCRAAEHEKHRCRMENVLRSAAGIIGNSQVTLDDLTAFAAERSLPMPPSIAAWIAGSLPPDKATPRTFERPHFITVGTIEGRKNHKLLLDIWKGLVACEAEPPLLVIAGQRGWEADDALAMLDGAAELRPHVIEMRQCDDEELAGMTAGARALLMPSFTEGFGLPVSEALSLGTPVIASDLPVFHEFAREIPTYLDPLDRATWQTAILEFVGNSPERERQLQAMKHYHAPDWPTHFKIVEDWLRSLSERPACFVPTQLRFPAFDL